MFKIKKKKLFVCLFISLLYFLYFFFSLFLSFFLLISFFFLFFFFFFVFISLFMYLFKCMLNLLMSYISIIETGYQLQIFRDLKSRELKMFMNITSEINNAIVTHNISCIGQIAFYYLRGTAEQGSYLSYDFSRMSYQNRMSSWQFCSM